MGVSITDVGGYKTPSFESSFQGSVINAELRTRLPFEMISEFIKMRVA